MTTTLEALRDLVLRHAHGRRTETAIPRVVLHVVHGSAGPTSVIYEPMLCLVLQGTKQVMVGCRCLHYDPASYLVASIDMPATGRILEAGPGKPYVSITYAFDPALIADLAMTLPPPIPERTAATPGCGVSANPMTPELLDAWLRLLRLLEAPADLPVLAPLLEREIVYRLLQGPQGATLRQIASADSRLSRIRRAIAWMRERYARPLRVAEAAAIAGMSPSSFHRHFKAITAVSPLQYQKALRLQQARRLLLAGGGDAARAAYAVGYESASQFSREYARAFGEPPVRDIARLRADAAWMGEAREAAAE